MSLLRQTIESFGAGIGISFRAEFCDGAGYQSRPGQPAFVLRFRTRGAELRTLLLGHVGLIESYIDGDLEVEGDLGAAFQVGLQSPITRQGSSNPLLRLRNAWHELRHANSTCARAKENARFHYALGTDFYRQWLDDPYLMYTCAYWKEGTRTLEEAQQNKMEHVCRKLRLAPGDRVVDIGCGWGGFLRYAHERHGVTGVGVNTTTEQVRDGQAELERLGLAGKLRLVDADFREVQGQFDKVVSIGVLEHAGRDQLFDVVKAHADSLKPGGLGMLHFIGHVGRSDTELWIREHIFPGGWIPGLAEALQAMERCGLEILDVENLRRNYALTLDEWTKRFESNWGRIRALDPAKFDERFRRKWRAYLVSCAEMFRSPAGYTHLFQILYAKGNVTTQVPMGRGYMYP